MLTLIIFILIIGFLIAIHELGHLIAAKWANVYCYEYSIGMGPLLYKHQFKETQFSLRLIPIGGYVAMAGENEASAQAYPDVVVPQGRRLYEVKKWKQVIVMLAGVTMNVIVAFGLMACAIFVNSGYNDLSTRPSIITSVIDHSPAQLAGLKVNDHIIALTDENGSSIVVNDFNDVVPYIDGSTITLTVENNDTTRDVRITPVYDQTSQSYLLGITTPSGVWKQATLFNVIPGSYSLLKEMTVAIVDAFVGIFTGDGLTNVSGVVGAYQATDQVIDMGVVSVLMFVAMFSLNLAIFNAIPIPALDGGRVLLLILGMIFGKRISKKMESNLITVSFILILGLTIIITAKDIFNLF